jgi:hypothetical protein
MRESEWRREETLKDPSCYRGRQKTRRKKEG